MAFGWDTIKNNWTRAWELAKTARETGPRGGTPEYGVGEFLRGITGSELDQADANDPNFTNNLRRRISNLPEERREVFEQDLAQDNANARQAWLDRTSRSPAARAFGNSEEANERRWQTHLANQRWRRDNNRSVTNENQL